MPAHIENRRLVLRSGARFEHPFDGSVVADNTKVSATNGTTVVNVFGSQGAPFAMTITDFEVNSLDTTAGNISLKVNGNVVATIAKGTTAGVYTGSGALSNTTVNQGDAVTLVSSSAGNARSYITYTVNGV